MLAPRFDLINLEFRFDENHEVFQVPLEDFAGVRLIVSASDSFAKGVGGDGDAISGCGRKLQGRAGTCVDGGLQAGPKHSRCRGGSGLRKKMSSSSGRQSGASLAE